MKKKKNNGNITLDNSENNFRGEKKHTKIKQKQKQKQKHETADI